MAVFGAGAILCSLLNPLGQGANVAEATPFGVEIRSHQYNLCERACPEKTGDPYVAVNLMMNLENPHTLSMNEVCRQSTNAMAMARGIALTFYVAKDNNTGCGPAWNGKPEFGNAAYVVGTSQVGVEAAFFNQTGSSEVRGYACRRGSTFVGYLVSCSAHLVNQNTTVAVQQANEYAFWVGASGSMNQPMRVLSGDFNLTPNERPTVFKAGSAAHYDRLVIGLTLPTPTPNKTADYIHILRPQLEHEDVASKHCWVNYSDHCYLYGRYR